MRAGFLREIAAVAAALSIAVPALGAPLQDELRSLVTEHPLIKSNQAQVSSAAQGTRATLAPFLPSLDLTGDYGYEHVSIPAFRASPDGPFETGAHNYAATLKENVWDGGRKYANRAGAKLNEEAVGATLTSVRQNVILEGVTAYINLLRQNELVDLSGQNEGNIRKQLNLEDERVRRGSGIAVDVLQAKSRLQVSLERLVAYRGAFQDAHSRYTQVFGHPAEVGAMPVPNLPKQLLPATVEDAIAIALKENPNVAVSDKRIDITHEQKKAAQAEYQPSFDIVVQEKYQDNYFGSPGIRRDRTAKLQVTWNLFGGFGTTARSSQAAYDEVARMNDAAETRRKTEEQVRLAWQTLQTTTERVSLLENAVNIASEVFEARKKLRESGKETVINVLDAENEVFSARIAYTSASYDARLAVYQLLSAIGRLEFDRIGAALTLPPS
ncbi:MAG: TolC family outer membrane protein [Rhodospirillaceae bacterium]